MCWLFRRGGASICGGGALWRWSLRRRRPRRLARFGRQRGLQPRIGHLTTFHILVDVGVEDVVQVLPKGLLKMVDDWHGGGSVGVIMVRQVIQRKTS